MENNEELPEIKNKVINGVELSNLDISKIAMVCDYLVLDHFQEVSSFIRLEQCFGPFFSKESPDFLPSVLQEICGPKKKYITFGRLISAYAKWKSKSSTNENFNKFMDLVFGDMIKTQDEVIGKLVEGGRIFSTKNTRGRKVISRFSVLTDETKNQIQGFHIQYDDFFDTVLSPKKTRDDITLEMNFAPNGRNIRDRDGISHIGGKYSITKGFVKFLIFKCRSGKTFYIGDAKEEEGEQFEFFLFGTSSCQLKSVRVELVNGQLIYLEPKFQPSLRVNQKIVDFDSIDEKYIDEFIINGPLIFEENEMQNIPLEQLVETNSLLIPCVSDDAFIDKKTLFEPLAGKDFNEIYKTYLVAQNEQIDKEKEELKQKMYEKTIMRKHLLKVYFNKFKIRENIEVLKTKKQPEERINMDKFLCKIKGYRKKINKKIEKIKSEEEDLYGDNEVDWEGDVSIENSEYKDEVKPKEFVKEEIKDTIEIEGPKIDENVNNEENKVEEQPKSEENKNEDNAEGQKTEEIKLEAPGEDKIVVDLSNDQVNEAPQQEKIKLKVNIPKKLLKKLAKKAEEANKESKNEEIKSEEPKIEEPKVEEIKVEPPKVEEEEVKKEEPKEEEVKVEPPKVEEIKQEEPKVEEIKVEPPKVEEEEVKKEEPKVEEVKVEPPKVEEIKQEEPKVEEIKVDLPNVEEIKQEEPKVEEVKVEPPKVEEIKQEEIKIEEIKVEPPKVEEVKKVEDKNNKINTENTNNNKINEVNNNNNNAKEDPKNNEPPKTVKKKNRFCLCF